VHFAGERTRLPQAGMAFDLCGGSDPGLPLLLGQPLAPRLGDGPERTPCAPPRRCANVPGDKIPPATQLPASHVEDVVTVSAALGYVDYYHVASFLTSVATRLGRLTA